MAILSRPEYAGFGPILAAEYLQQCHGIHVGRETLRGWMAAAGLWKPRRRKPGRAHLWCPRRRCRGELVQGDTSEHDWLEGRGEKLYARFDPRLPVLGRGFDPRNAKAYQDLVAPRPGSVVCRPSPERPGLSKILPCLSTAGLSVVGAAVASKPSAMAQVVKTLISFFQRL